MALYVVFLCWSSIMSEPASEACNTRPRQTGYGTWVDILVRRTVSGFPFWGPLVQVFPLSFIGRTVQAQWSNLVL